MKARIPARNVKSGSGDRTASFDDLLDREIESTVRHLMMQSPSSRIYPAVSEALRDRPRFPRSQPVALVFMSGVAVAILLVVATFAALGPHAAQVDAGGSSGGILSLTWVSNTDLARWINESESILAYPGILFLHTLGLAMVVGFSLAVDARLVGIASRIPAASLRRLFPYIWLGFFVNAVSGLLLFVADIRKASNPLFAIKLGLVALGVVSMTLIDRELSRTEGRADSIRDPSTRSKILGIASVVIWFAAIAAGRLLAYVHGN